MYRVCREVTAPPGLVRWWLQQKHVSLFIVGRWRSRSRTMKSVSPENTQNEAAAGESALSRDIREKKIRLVFKCMKFLYVKRAQAQPLPPHANKISSDRTNADAELRRGVWAARRPLSWCFGVIAATQDRLNKTNMSGFSYLSADSGLVSSAAVAHRARTASRRSAGAGRSGALWSGDDCMSWNATCLRAAASSPFAFI